MKRLVLAAAVGLTCLAAFPASATTEREVVLDRATLADGTIAAEWEGLELSGANTSFFLDGLATTGSCADTDATDYCDTTLVQVDPDLVLGTAKPTLTFRIEGFRPVDDFDLRVYESNAAGEARTYLGSPESDNEKTSPLGDLDLRNTGAGDFETKVVTGVKPGRYYLVEVVYFAVAQGSYTGKATLTGVPAQPEPEPTATPTEEPATTPQG